MADFDDDDDLDGDDYFAEVDPNMELTGLEPRFVSIEGMDMTGADLAALTVDKLVPLYIACRNQLATDTKGYKTRRERVKTFMGMISMTLRDKADAVGTDTFRGTYGTAYRQVKEKFSINDWTAFTNYLKQTQNFQILQKRVSPNAVKEIREADGALPPGVQNFTEVEFAVRSPSAKRTTSK